jgi:hypothetical protein
LQYLVLLQGDQIGRIFALWAIVCFGQFLKNNSNSPQFWATFFQSIDYVVILTKNGLGCTLLGDFFTISSGVDVMITIFCDFRQFSAKKLAFFSKTNVMIKILHNLALF